MTIGAAIAAVSCRVVTSPPLDLVSNPHALLLEAVGRSYCLATTARPLGKGLPTLLLLDWRDVGLHTAAEATTPAIFDTTTCRVSFAAERKAAVWEGCGVTHIYSHLVKAEVDKYMVNSVQPNLLYIADHCLLSYLPALTLHFDIGHSAQAPKLVTPNAWTACS